MAEEKNKKEETKKEGATSVENTDEQKRREILQTYHIELKEGERYSGRYRAVVSWDGAKNKDDRASKGTYDTKDDQIFKGGFYYDRQLEDPFMSISLHANKQIDKDGNWVKWKGNHLEPISEDYGEWSKCYGADPIARCIMSEDLSYSIVNNFSDYNGGNPIEDAFTNIKPFAPILGKWGAAMKEATSKTPNMGSGLVEMMTGAAEKIANVMTTASGYLNKALFVQGTRFSYYNGTQFNFNNMEMKFIAFSDYVQKKDGGEWEFQSVEDYIKTLQPYVMGIYSKYSADFLKESGIQGDLKEWISEYVGFQDPPSGFRMDTKNLNNTLEGTLRMNIGGTWAIDNLVIKGMNVNMSRVQAKHPERQGETVPLYAEISLQLSPAAAFVDSGYKNILEHKGMGGIRSRIKEGYVSKLRSLKDSYNGNK